MTATIDDLRLPDDQTVPDGHRTLLVLDLTGHSTFGWDPSSRDDVAAARAHFDTLRGKGYRATRQPEGGGRPETVHAFDPEDRELTMAPPTAGGWVPEADGNGYRRGRITAPAGSTPVTFTMLNGDGQRVGVGYTYGDIPITSSAMATFTLNAGTYSYAIAPQQYWYDPAAATTYYTYGGESRRAGERARALLLSRLTDEQRESYEARGEFDVIGSAGTRFTIGPGVTGNVVAYDDQGRMLVRVCAHPQQVPQADVHLAQMLHLQTDEASFMAVGNTMEGSMAAYQARRLDAARSREVVEDEAPADRPLIATGRTIGVGEINAAQRMRPPMPRWLRMTG